MWTFAAGLPFNDGDFSHALPVSLRFDLMVSAWISTPLLAVAVLAPIFPAGRLAFIGVAARHWCSLSYVVFCWTWLLNFGFYGEYRDQFNQTIFGAVDDDGVAILKTIAHGFHWERYLGAAALVVMATWGWWKLDVAGRLSRKFTPDTRPRTVWIFCILMVMVAAGCYRGGYGARPPQQKDLCVCRADAANRLVANPVFLLRVAVKERLSVVNPDARPPFLHDIRSQAALFSRHDLRGAKTISQLLLHETAGPLIEGAAPPRHVYLFVMESYDRWPMVAPYDSIGLTPELQRIEKVGVSSPIFVSAGGGTMPSLTAIMTGLPFNGAPQNYQKLSRKPFPTSLAPTFSRLGYKTRFVYGGYGSWQRIADFARDQGFDEIVTGSQVSCDAEDCGEWGVPDGALFSHLAELSGRDVAPTFTVILSTSYHPPYALNLPKFGCDDAVMPDALRSRYDREHSMRVFSHLKYADCSLGRVVDTMLAKDPDSLFAITGDHWSRKFINSSPALSERKCVPFVLYGPKHLPASARLAPGVHTDIAPTLVRLCAPKGFSFATFGCDLFSTPSRPGAEGNGVVVHRDGMFLKENSLQFSGMEPAPGHVRDAIAFTDAQKALSWWMLLRGDTLPSASEKAR